MNTKRAQTNRRDFIKGCAIATAGMALPLQAQETGQKACLHLFSKPLGWLGFDALAEVTAAAGYGGLDLTVRPGGHVEPERVVQDLPCAVAAARKQGLRVDMIVTNLISAQDPGAEKLLKTAAQCGVKIYRTGYFRYDDKLGVDGTLEQLNQTMAGLADLNQSCGITGCYQNHYAWKEGLFGGAVWDIYYILKGLDPAWIGCQYDVRHAIAESAGSWVAGMRRIAPYIRSLCLKDFEWEKRKGQWRPISVLAGQGLVPWERFYGLLQELAVHVPASVHCEWPLFSKEEQGLDALLRRRLAAERLQRDTSFFAGQYAKFGATTGSAVDLK